VDDVEGFFLDLFPKCHVESNASRFARFPTRIYYLKLATDWTYYRDGISCQGLVIKEEILRDQAKQTDTFL
jgi:hypothetical protein